MDVRILQEKLFAFVVESAHGNQVELPSIRCALALARGQGLGKACLRAVTASINLTSSIRLRFSEKNAIKFTNSKMQSRPSLQNISSGRYHAFRVDFMDSIYYVYPYAGREYVHVRSGDL